MTLRLPRDGGERILLVLLLVATFLLVLEPGWVPLFEPDEGRYAEIPREMLATGDFLTPRLNGVLYFEKPPLYYWSVAASMAVLGPTELAVRLPGKLSAAGMVLLAAAFARRRWGVRTGLLAGLVLATSFLVFALGRVAIIDPMLSLAMSGAAFAFAAFAEGDAEGDEKRARRALYGFHVACAAAVLLKGLIGVVLPGGAIVFWTVVTGRWRTLARVFSPGPLLAFLVLAVPWHVAMAREHPDFLQFYFVHEHFQRFASAGHRRTGPAAYFVPVVLGGFLPWTAFLGSLRETWPGLRPAAWKERATEGFLWTFGLLVFVFFSASRSKLIPYVLPIWPALAVLLALGIERSRARGASFRGARVATGVLFGALLCVAAAYGFGAGYLARFGAAGAGACVLLALLGGFVLNVSPRLTPRADAAVLVAAPWLAFTAFLLAVLPGAARWVTPWPVVEPALRALTEDAVLVQRGHYVEVLPFYAKRLTPISALGWSELDFGRSHPGTEALFPSDEAFWDLWNGAGKVVVMVHRGHLNAFAKPPLAETPALLLGSQKNGKHHVLTNRITESKSK